MCVQFVWACIQAWVCSPDCRKQCCAISTWDCLPDFTQLHRTNFAIFIQDRLTNSFEFFFQVKSIIGKVKCSLLSKVKFLESNIYFISFHLAGIWRRYLACLNEAYKVVGAPQPLSYYSFFTCPLKPCASCAKIGPLRPPCLFSPLSGTLYLILWYGWFLLIIQTSAQMFPPQ